MNSYHEKKWGSNTPQQENVNTTNSIYVDDDIIATKNNTKKGLFKSSKKPRNQSVSSEFLWREMNLFIPELIGLMIALFAGIGAILFIRVLGGDELIGLISMIGIAIPVAIMAIFFVLRKTMFQPSRNRYLTARFMKTGAIRLSIDSFKDEMPFGKDHLSDKLKVVDPKAHFEEKTGKPFVLLFEGDDRNADLKNYASQVTTKGKDSNTINDMAVDYGRRIERFLAEGKSDFLTPTNILLILILAGVGLALFFLLKNPETTAQLLGAPVGMILP